jgi:hypothetical protein
MALEVKLNVRESTQEPAYRAEIIRAFIGFKAESYK